MIIHGRNIIIEALKTHQKIKNIWMSKTAHGSAIEQIKKIARKQAKKIQFVTNNLIDKKAGSGVVHQGVLAEIEHFFYTSLATLLETLPKKNVPSIFVILDQINDPHNLGAIIRTAECAGCTGLIFSQASSAGITPTVIKVSSGAVFHLPIIKTYTLKKDIDILKKNGFTIYATALDASTPYYKENYKKNIALVLGNEATGIQKFVRSKADIMINIPILGKSDSLNVSNSAAIFLYQMRFFHQR